jgi:arylsulfatase A-like enzyme
MAEDEYTARPNVVLITADQLNFRHLGCMGHPVVRTPNIDRLAAEGALLRNAYSQAPLCMPSRASFNTGLYPHSCQVQENPVVLLDRFPTLAERLREAGYRTGGFGHIGGDGIERGFETCIDIYHEPLKRVFGEEYTATMGEGFKPGWFCGRSVQPEGETRDEQTRKVCCDYIRDADPSEPFYVQCDFFAPHPPLVAPARYLDLYSPEDVVLPPTWRDELAGKPSNVRATRKAIRMEGVSEERMREALRHYYALVTFIDDQVGLIRRELEAKGVLENTLIIFTADHGDYAGECGIIGKTGELYECMVHVPLIVHAPRLGIAEGTTVESLVELVDLVPTVLDATGIDHGDDLEGQTLLPLLRGNAPVEERVAMSETRGYPGLGAFDHEYPEEMLKPIASDTGSTGPCNCTMTGTMMRKGTVKLTLYTDGSMELYDLADDPYERNNIVGNPAYDAIVADLTRRIAIKQMETWPRPVRQAPLPYHWKATPIQYIGENYHEAKLGWEAQQAEGQAAGEDE